VSSTTITGAQILQLILPPGSQGAVGTDILFRNLGAHAFSINDSSLDSSVIISPGQSIYFYLIDNSTTDGIWHNVGFGTGTSYADASTLQGAGLTTLLGKLATSQNVVDITSPKVIDDNARASTYVWGGGVGTLSLPAPATLSSGWYIMFRNAGTGSLNFTPPSPTLINGVPSITTNPGDSGFIILDKTVSPANYITVGLTSPSNAVFSAATYDVDAISGSTFSLVSNAPVIQTYIAQSGTRTTELDVILPAITQIYVLLNDTNQPYDITFKCVGSSQPALPLATGQVATVLSDGTTLYPLTQVSSSTFFAANGSVSAPSFSFLNDSHTGMYLKGTSVTSISVNSTDMIVVDNSNTSAPLVTINGRVAATLISGGTF
jgi:hypothetical protein